MLVIGVRSSWLTVEMKVSLTLVDLAQPLDGAALGLQRVDERVVGAHPVGDVLGGAHVAGDHAAGRRRSATASSSGCARCRPCAGTACRWPGVSGSASARATAVKSSATPSSSAFCEIAAGGVEHGGELAEHVRLVVPQQPLGAGVEERDPADLVGADDREVGAVDDAGRPCRARGAPRGRPCAAARRAASSGCRPSRRRGRRPAGRCPGTSGGELELLRAPRRAARSRTT